MSVQVTRFDGAPREWDDFVAADPGGSITHSFDWGRVIERVYGHSAELMVARDNGAIKGVLPLVNMRSLVFGRFTVSMPYLNAGGPLGSEPAIVALTDAALSIAQQNRMSLLELRCRAPLPIGLEAAHEKVSCVLPLETPPSSVWNRFGAKLRSQIRRPMKAGCEVRFGADQLEPFFIVFARNMRDLGSPPHPLRFFEEIMTAFGDRVWFGCVYLHGAPVAAGCALAYRSDIEMTWASALREFSAAAPNMLLYWSFIERACEAGFLRFDFGRCTPGTGSHHFKRQWGTHDVALHWYRSRCGRSRQPPKQQEGALSLASRIWRRMPTQVATRIGTHLRGGIPS